MTYRTNEAVTFTSVPDPEPRNPIIESAQLAPTPIRRRRSTARRAWGPFARFFLRHLFRGMNR